MKPAYLKSEPALFAKNSGQKSPDALRSYLLQHAATNSAHADPHVHVCPSVSNQPQRPVNVSPHIQALSCALLVPFGVQHLLATH
jgi:hypothetical protein